MTDWDDFRVRDTRRLIEDIEYTLAHTVRNAADAHWKILSGALPRPLGGVGEQAFISEDTGSDESQVAVRSGNANLNIRLLAKKSDADSQKTLRAAAPAIASDLLGSLVPA